MKQIEKELIRKYNVGAPRYTLRNICMVFDQRLIANVPDTNIFSQAI